MNAREERGLVIAAVCKLNKTENGWLVPSQSKGETIYTVDPVKQTCTCPDHAESGHKCKHIYAVEFTVKREFNPDGTDRYQERDVHGEGHVQAGLASVQ